MTTPGWRGVAVLLLLALPVPARAGRHWETDHFYLFCRERDYNNHTITDADFTRWGEWLEASYTKLVGNPGLQFRLPIHPVPADVKIKVLVHDFATADEQYKPYAQNPGFAVPATGRIHLNQPHYLNRARDEANKCTVAHELFHLIQYAYDNAEEDWLKESTARWAPGAIFPDIDQAHYCIGAEEQFLDRSYLPLSFDFAFGAEGAARRSTLRSAAGHPYGASSFFRFVAKQGNDQAVVRRIWDAAATPGPNALEAIAKGVGGAAALDAKFREVYDRFAIGCAMNDRAPVDCQLADVAKLVRGGKKVSSPRTNLSAAWLEHCRHQADPKTFAAFVPAFIEPPDLVALAQGNVPHGGIGGAMAGWVGGRGGIRCFTLAKAPVLTADTSLEVTIPAAADELSLQAVARYNGRDIKVLHATYADGKHTLKITDLMHTGPSVVLIVTGYANSIAARNYPLSIALRQEPDVMKISWHYLPTLPSANCIAVTAPAPFKIDLWHAPLNGPFHGYQYTLYWAQAANGPFTAILPPLDAGEQHASHTVAQANYKMEANQFALLDRTVGPGDKAIPHKPMFYQVGELPVTWDAQDKVIEHGTETRSNVIGPGNKAVIRIDGAPDDAAEIQRPGGFRELKAAMALEEQQHQFWNAHLTVQCGGMVFHSWTPRREGARTYGDIYYNLAYGRIAVPPWSPEDVTITAQSDGLTATRTLKLPLSEEWSHAQADSAKQQEKALGDQLATLALKRAADAKSLQEVEDHLKKPPTDPHDAVLDTETWTGYQAMYQHALKVNDDYDVPSATMLAQGNIALKKRDAEKAMEWASQGPTLEQKRYEAEIGYENEKEPIYRKTLSSPLLKADEKKRTEEAVVHIQDYKKQIEKEHKQRLYDSQRALMKMAADTGHATAFSAALSACLADPDAADADGSLLSDAAEQTARVVGDRAAAAALQRRAFQRELAKAKPEQQAQIRKNWDNALLNVTWWPEGDAGNP